MLEKRMPSTTAGATIFLTSFALWKSSRSVEASWKKKIERDTVE
jgi:hypothetical protein